LGYEGKGDFRLKTKKKVSNLLRNRDYNEYMFTGLQIINPKTIEDTMKKKFSLREIYFKLISKKTIYGFVDQNEWYHISKENDYKRVNKIL
jgi:NDP-sugar pyrophosphorylase family protein